MQYVEQIGVVAGIDLGEDVVGAGGEMTVYNLGNLAEALHHLVILRGIVEDDADVGAGLIADCARIDDGAE